MDVIELLVTRVAAHWHVAAFAFAAFTALELAFPRERQSLIGRIPGVIFWGLWFPVSVAVDLAFDALWQSAGVRPLLRVDVGSASLWIVIAVAVATTALYDFFFYWCHRFQHRFLWRWHAVHHSVRELNTVNAYHHVSEPVVQSILIILPMSLVVADSGAAPTIVVALVAAQSWLIHSASRLHFGPIAAVLVDNRFHRIHHSVDPQHFDRNFGAFTTLWDRLFGTAWMPRTDEWPDTGIAELDQPRSVGEWVSLPWRFPKLQTSAPAMLTHI
ncbi:sterol desaturase family protein [Sphingomonas sp. Y38-1Y]|uniref:sterol desaturase family protein n=1 Tax=Sphingomonas sp. Y38-1Y TaxID=3078265 RepID=UPI0028F04D79|nr:sterol desaturase family protein [Sphingomonas sp. Y38-1Y]